MTQVLLPARLRSTSLLPQVPVVVTEQERVTGTHEHHEHHHGHLESAGMVGHHHAGTERVAERMAEQVCGQKTFTEVEDRPVVRERVERIVEHRPVEKQVGCCATLECSQPL